MTIQQGWREQYDRMLRSHSKLMASGRGEGASDSNAARDQLFQFFQDAYHLKDWLKADPKVRIRGQVLEDVINASKELGLCADLCNGTKHGRLTRSRSGDVATTFVSQSVNVRVGNYRKSVSIGSDGKWDGGDAGPFVAASVSGPTGYTTHTWIVESNGAEYDAHELADAIVASWDLWLGAQGLLPSADA